MAKYLIESPHTHEECLKALDEIQSKGLLEKFDFGCQAGEHVGWATVDAANDSAAKEMVPGFLRNKAHVVKLNKFTSDQIRAFHQK